MSQGWIRVIEAGDELHDPANVAPDTQTVLDHVQVALKHEGVNLQILDKDGKVEASPAAPRI